MKALQKQKTIYLVESTGLDIIRIDEHSSSLAFNTSVKVNTEDNTAIISYSVRPWNSNTVFKHINKSFENYDDAFDYYNEILNKYPNVINPIAAMKWWKDKSFLRKHFEKKYPLLDFDKESDIIKAAEQEIILN